MFIGIYLFLFLITFLSILIWKSPIRGNQPQGIKKRQWFYYYTGLSILMMVLGLAIFLFLSAWISILFLGETASYNLPLDFISEGLIGWLTLLVGLAGILSPIFAAFIINHSTNRKSQLKE